MNIWTISLFDPTPYDNVGNLRFIQIANAAIKGGHQVTHFTSTFRHTSKKQRFNKDTTLPIEPGYSVEYIRSKGYKKNISIKRIFAHRDFAQQLIDSLAGRHKPDIIFISMPPIVSAARVVEWASENDIPIVVDIIDPWPDSFIKDVPNALKPLSRVFIQPFYNRVRGVFRNADAVTSISNGYLDWAKSQCKTIRQTKCFYPAQDLEAIQSKIEDFKKTESRNEEVLRIIYVGSLGSSYDIPAIVKASEIMDKKHPGQTEFIVAGVGPQSEIVEEYQKKLGNLQYLGWISDEELIRQYFLSDLGLIQHKNNFTQTVTYKLFSYLSAGLPILNSLQSEMADIISENNVGLNNMNGDYKKLVKNIEYFLYNRDQLQLYKQNAIALTKEKGDSNSVYGEMIAFFEEIAGTRVAELQKELEKL
ncbi:glycosyltransferase family 4 protein [Fodinibius saliphilus]|uniref:glycosyltransferase family 4 protein n=1 Tax=Fodinibius saliphilus TaxID=1920650 RepID=UPI001108A699|nr:glycosyltransferase family 4 protein [Fodinibius saliphilus]